MKTQLKIFTVTLLVTGVLVLLFHFWRSSQPRRDAIQALENFSNTFQSGKVDALRQEVVLPRALQGDSEAEQSGLIARALQDEISADGVVALKNHAAFGPLAVLFPAEASRWTSQAGIKPEDCVAFKMERHGIRAEVVLFHTEDTYRVVRCNNVKQMAENPGNS